MWKKIKNFPMYEISSNGNVRSRFSNKILRNRVNCYGYMDVTLVNNKGRKYPKIHRLVAEAFLKRKKGHNHVNHKDGIKTNNKLSNLEWCTPSQNLKHAVKMGLHRSPRRNVLTEKQVIIIYRSKGKILQRVLAKKFNVKQVTISNIWTQTNWSWLTKGLK